jgi:hypothetical protein
MHLPLARCGLVLAAILSLGSLHAGDASLARFGDQNLARNPGEGNPIIPGLFADPSLAKFGDTYYIYATTDGFGWETGRWVVWKSKDFVHWNFSGESFPEITGKKNWAPGVPIFKYGKYWMPFTLNGDGNHLAVADSPEGPFKFANDGKALTGSIDAEFFVDADGSVYLISGNFHPVIWKMKPDLSGVAEKVATLDFNKGYVEGAFLFKRNGIYYAAVGNLGYAEYRIIYMMSDKLEGPWRSPENDVIVAPIPSDHIWGTGHGNVLRIPGTDEWVVIYLRSRMGEYVDPFRRGNVYRQVCADRIEFNTDGTIKSAAPTRKGVGLLAPSTSAGTNVAFGKKATATSSLARYEPAKSVDGNFGTRWIAGWGDLLVPTAETVANEWRFTTEKPSGEWRRPDFDVSEWNQGKGGFGNPETPNSIVGTEWRTSDIWLRHDFSLTRAQVKGPLQIRMCHDEDVEVYLNGVLAFDAAGNNEGYEQFEIRPEAVAALTFGRNVLAVHCRQTGGGQFIDVGITTAGSVEWVVDLGEIMDVERVEISLNFPTEITPYVVDFKTSENRIWELYADHRQDRVHESPKVDRRSVRARYFRVDFPNTARNSLPVGIWEFKAFNTL